MLYVGYCYFGCLILKKCVVLCLFVTATLAATRFMRILVLANCCTVTSKAYYRIACELELWAVVQRFSDSRTYRYSEFPPAFHALFTIEFLALIAKRRDFLSYKASKITVIVTVLFLQIGIVFFFPFFGGIGVNVSLITFIF